MASVNKVILIGNLGSDPQTRYTNSGDAVCNFSLATSEQWKDKSGEKQERTEWHRVQCWGRLAEIAGEYLQKGRSVYVEGRIRSSKYTDKEGVERTSYDIVCEALKLLGSKGERQGERPERQESRPKDSPKKPTDDFDDDIPF